MKYRFGPVARETLACMMPLLFAALLFACLFLLALIPSLGNRSCVYASSISQPPTQLQGFACAEFFLNRYQTLVGVFAAFLVGLIAVRPVWLQVKLLSQQAILSGQSIVAGTIEQNARDTERLDKIKVNILHQMDTLDWLVTLEAEEPESFHIKTALQKAFTKLNACTVVVIAEWSDFSDHARLTDAERALRDTLLRNLGKLSTLTHVRVPSPEESPETKSARDLAWIKNNNKRLVALAPSFRTTWDEIMSALRTERADLIRHTAAVRQTITAAVGERHR